MIKEARPLGCFQIESPGQRELVRKLAPETVEDLIVDISLFRPGPVSSDMISPFLQARHGLRSPSFPHQSPRDAPARDGPDPATPVEGRRPAPPRAVVPRDGPPARLRRGDH